MAKENENITYVDVEDLLNSDISYQNVPTPIDTIITRMDSGSYLIPEYQRNYVWDEKQVVALIVSLLKNIPIPRLYMYSNPEDGKYTVIDGQQRITSLYFFIKGIFPVSLRKRHYYRFKEINELLNEFHSSEDNKEKKNLEKKLRDEFGLKFYTFKYDVRVEDENKRTKVEKHVLDYKKFDPKDSLVFNNKTLDFGVVFAKSNTKSKSIYTDIFRLLNSGGSPLSNQEIRNGIYYKNKLYKMIHDFDHNMPIWQKLKKNDNNRHKNVEFLLRLLALDYYINFEENNDFYTYYSKKRDYIDFSLEDVRDFFNLNHYTGKYSDLIDRFSDRISALQEEDKFIEENIAKLTRFMESIEDIPEKDDFKINKLSFEAFYIACTKLDYLDGKYKLSYNTINSFQILNTSTAATREVVRRIIMAIGMIKD